MREKLRSIVYEQTTSIWVFHVLKVYFRKYGGGGCSHCYAVLLGVPIVEEGEQFKNLPIKITFTTSNSIGRLLNPKPNSALDNSGIYRLTWPDCQMKYVGQTRRSFRTKFQEYYRNFRHNNAKSNFATHFLENQHSLGIINDIMNILHITKRGRAMDTIERYHIYKETKNGAQINDKNTMKPNTIYETIIQGEANRMSLRNRSNTGQT